MTKFNKQELISNHPNCTCINRKLSGNKPILPIVITLKRRQAGRYHAERCRTKRHRETASRCRASREKASILKVSRETANRHHVERHHAKRHHAKNIKQKDITRIGIMQAKRRRYKNYVESGNYSSYSFLVK